MVQQARGLRRRHRECASCGKSSIVAFALGAFIGTTATKSVTPTFAYAFMPASIAASLPITATSAGLDAPPRSSVARYDGTWPYIANVVFTASRPAATFAVSSVGTIATKRGAARLAAVAAALIVVIAMSRR